MKAHIYVIFALFELITACQSSPVDPGNDLALYLVMTPVNLGLDAQALDKTSLTLANEPFIRYDQIEGYTADTYTFQVNESVINQLTKLSSDSPLAGKPFALVVDGA